MSQGLTKKGGKRFNQKSLVAGWRKVLELGEQLVALSQVVQPDEENRYRNYPDRGVILAQRSLIIHNAAELLDCDANLWLPTWLGEEIGYLRETHINWGEEVAETIDIFDEFPADRLVAEAVSKRQMVCLAVEVDSTAIRQQTKQVDESSSLAGEKIQRGSQCSGRAISAAAPLIAPARSESKSALLGVLLVHRRNEQPFQRSELDLIEGLAAQAAIAFQYNRQMAVERWRIEQLSLVAEVSKQLLSDLRDLDELAQRVTQLIQQSFAYDFVALYTLEAGEQALRYRASAVSDQVKVNSQSEEHIARLEIISPGEGIIGRVAQQGQEILIKDTRKVDHFPRSHLLPDTCSQFCLPLIVKERLLGVLDIQSYLPDDFHEIDVMVLRALVGNIALALEGTRLYSDLQRRAEYLTTIGEVSNAVVSILDLNNLLDEVVALIHERFGYPFVHLFSVHPGRRKIFFEAGSGSRSGTLAREGFSFNLDDSEGLIPWVARSGETIVANNVHDEPRYRPSPIFPEETQAELTVPLKFGQEVLGVLDIQSNQVNEFGLEEVFLVEALADSIAIALRNASLFRSEQWRRRVAESMREVAGMLSAEVGLDHILTAILSELEDHLPCEVAAIWFLEEENQDQNAKFPLLRLAAVRGSEGVWLEPQIGLNMDEILEPVAGEQNGNQDLPPPLWVLEALSTERPVTHSISDTNDWFGIAFEFPEDYSAVASTLRVGGKNIGLLTLAHHTSGRYGSEARAMTEAFASYASVAIQNARLYESTQEQVWISTVLLQTADAMQSTTTLDELLETVVHITPMLGGVKECAVYLLGEDQMFIPAASSGLTPEVEFEFKKRHYSPGEVPAFDHLLQERQATIIQRQGDDCRVAELFPPPIEKSGLLELVVLVPLQARGELLGALLVHHTTDVRKNPVQALEIFFGERLPIIQGIAHQAGLALDNIQLIKLQREEAYISVALLQVANAVVSSNDLQEALGSIVRITPILTGVKRAVIYLLNHKTSQLSLAEAYGLPRDAGIFTYELSEFPLVQSALEREALVAYPLNPLMDDEWEDVPEVWTYLAAPDQNEVDEYLASKERLLLILPLVIKSENLGVMIIEEPNNPLNQEKPGSATNQHLRMKRLEIATGISQQSALAIQNERLQQETVERERLEREMQLAREIQQTFLPEELPALDGWQINLWWRTAREVGGDFFDLFLLPSGELALVIADVADKGMGAAMYMILIRTLIRAIGLESRSPAEVLDRVNQLLLPDAHQGMFVTLFYGVLDPQKGLFQYSNAGHNPPLWIRKDACEIDSLPRSGMALGVVLDNEIEEQRIALLPGDFLILYTDGVTDAMNGDGMFYGSERLHQVVWEAAFGEHSPSGASAEFMLQMIDASTSEFVGDAPVVDDSTMLVLFRQPSD